MVEREQKTKEADARSPTLNASCSTSKHVYGNLVYSELASQARMLVDEGKQGCNDYNVCCKGNDFLVIKEISNEIFLFFFFDFIFSSRVTSACVFLFPCFFYKMQVHPLDSEQDNHILPFPTASLRHSILSFVSTEIAECLHKNGPISSRLSPRVSKHLRGCNFHSPKNLEKTPTFFRKSPTFSKKTPTFFRKSPRLFSFLREFLDFFPQCAPFLSPSLPLFLAHSREIIRLIYARICNFAQNYGKKARTTA